MGEIDITQDLEKNRSFVDAVIEETGSDIRQCYQCAKCSGGCPGTFAMDYLPNQIIRMLMLGMVDEVLKSKTIWVCMACNTCTTRCIRDIDVAAVMDDLRKEAIRHGYTEHAKNVIASNNTFLWTVKSWGRVFDAGMLMIYNMKTSNPMNNMQFALPTMLRGKSPIIPIPHAIKGVKEVKKIFEKAKQEGK
jgi:heterodisulfide reductase subunit C